MEQILNVSNLEVEYQTRGGALPAVRNVSFCVGPGEIVGVVGESGCGKSTIANALMRLLPPNGKITSGKILLCGRDLQSLNENQMRLVRGGEMSIIFQDPLTSLNPVFSIGRQMMDAVLAHRSIKRKEAKKFVINMLESVGIHDAALRFKDYPHQFSGGMQQRIMIATALLSTPSLLVADEPTSALDVVLEAQINDLIRTLRDERNMSILYITHNLGVVAQMCDRVIVMYAGSIVESGDVQQIFKSPQHPYTKALLNAHFSRDDKSAANDAGEDKKPEPQQPGVDNVRIKTDDLMVTAQNLSTYFGSSKSLMDRILKKQAEIRAVDGVTIDVRRGETLALVGESGSGKTTLGRTILRLSSPAVGQIIIDGKNITHLAQSKIRPMRAGMQMIFQDPVASLSPHKTVSSLLLEPYKIHGIKADGLKKDREMLETVGLPFELADKYPHQLSGGQARRVGIARALALNPELLIADEPTSGLDVSAALNILNLLKNLREKFNLTYVMITHDLDMTRYIADRVAVMYLGKIVEIARGEDLFTHPRHPYTEALLSAVAIPDLSRRDQRQRIILEGEIPSPLNPPSGCPFHPRCRYRQSRCESEAPCLRHFSEDDPHLAACHFPL